MIGDNDNKHNHEIINLFFSIYFILFDENYDP